MSKVSNSRWRLANWLSKLACKLRGTPWHLSDNMSGVPGNRAAELKQRIWERCVALETCSDNKDPEWLKLIEHELDELGQIAGENWWN